MNGIDTTITGDPESCERSARTLRGLRRSLGTLEDRLGSGERISEVDFDGLSADRFRLACRRSSQYSGRLRGDSRRLATQLTEYADQLRQVHAVLRRSRRTARAAGLRVDGDQIVRPDGTDLLDDYRALARIVGAARRAQTRAEAGLDAALEGLGSSRAPIAPPGRPDTDDLFRRAAEESFPGLPPVAADDEPGPARRHQRPLPDWPPAEDDWPTPRRPDPSAPRPSADAPPTPAPVPTDQRGGDAPAPAAPGSEGAGSRRDDAPGTFRPGRATLEPFAGTLEPPGTLSQPGSLSQPRTLDPADGLDPVGTLSQPRTLDPADGLDPVGTLSQPGTLDPANGLEPPGTLTQPGTLSQPGTLDPAGTLTATAALVPAVTLDPPGTLTDAPAGSASGAPAHVPPPVLGAGAGGAGARGGAAPSGSGHHLRTPEVER
ncbi:hypothetical protein [Nocardioides sambongensis]|uniref:hypothetical protein n=1 Tax=Nocardioides sambongensis TaxID=2589074 RepID=UPI0011282524|nr:hypothetical protein [Nocardioides sambongensis]